MPLARRFGGYRARSLRIAGPGRLTPPTRRAFGRRPGGVTSIRYARMARGGFFKKLFKGVKKVVRVVTKVPVLRELAKTAIGSLPIVGRVVTAVNAFKAKTAVGVAGSPVGAGTPASNFNQRVNRRAPSRRKTKKAKKSARRSRGSKAKAKRKGGGSAKQRAARARFAKAAKKGRIRKGQRL